MRPLPFHDIYLIDRSALNPPDPSGPWVEAEDQGLPATSVVIWPDAMKPTSFVHPRPYYVAIDPLALVLSGAVYVKFTLPDPPPIDVFTAQARSVVKAMTPEEKKLALDRLKALGVCINTLQKELAK